MAMKTKMFRKSVNFVKCVYDKGVDIDHIICYCFSKKIKEEGSFTPLQNRTWNRTKNRISAQYNISIHHKNTYHNDHNHEQCNTTLSAISLKVSEAQAMFPSIKSSLLLPTFSLPPMNALPTPASRWYYFFQWLPLSPSHRKHWSRYHRTMRSQEQVGKRNEEISTKLCHAQSIWSGAGCVGQVTAFVNTNMFLAW